MTATEKLFLNTHDLAQMLGRSTRSIYNDIRRQNWHRLPPPGRIGKRLIWGKKQVNQWANEKLQPRQ